MFGGEIKVIGDSYAGGFSCGMTLGDNGTMQQMETVIDNEDRTVYEDSQRGLSLTVNHIKENDVWNVVTEVTNNGKQPVTLELLSSFLLKDVKVDRVHRMQSFWSAEGKLKSESITDLHMEKSWNGCACRVEKFGNVGSMPVRKYFPFLVVEDCEKGEFTGVQLYLASSWQIEMRCREKETYTISGGIADRDFGQWTKKLNAGETFTAPKAVVAKGKTLLEVCDKLVKAQKPDISDKDKSMGIIFNEYCTTWGNPTYDNVKKVCDKIAGKGIDFLVIDSGWYGNVDGWWNMVGDWTVNEKRFPGGMKPIADYIRSKGMIPGLWFEMESVNSGAKQFEDAELLVKKDGYPLTVANKRFWDMENEDAVAYLTENVIGKLKDAGFGYLKVDYNDTMGMGCDGTDGPGENLRKKVEASREFFRKIKREIPDIVIENCSSGGHRLEPSMMELASQASFSDAHETTAIPIIAANLHRVIEPKQSQIWAVMRAGDTDERIFYSIVSTYLGRMCLSGDIYDLSDHQWKLVEDGMDFYRQAADIIKDGSTIYIKADTESYNNPTGEQLVVRKLGNRYLVIYHRFENSKDMPFDLADKNVNVLAEYGHADVDFSAQAWILEAAE